MPVDSPHVANAETTSNSTVSSLRSVIASRTRHATSTIVALTSETAIATWSASRGMCRPNASTSRSPRASARIARSMMASVVTLMPPAVDAAPPPTNMSASSSSQVPSCICPTETVEKPPERGMTPARSEARTVAGPSSFPKVCGLVHSNAATSNDPVATRARLVTIVSLACRFRRRGLRRCRATSRLVEARRLRLRCREQALREADASRHREPEDRGTGHDDTGSGP